MENVQKYSEPALSELINEAKKGVSSTPIAPSSVLIADEFKAQSQYPAIKLSEEFYVVENN